jgi:hypothetical protein
MFTIISPHQPVNERHESGLYITDGNGNVSCYISKWVDADNVMDAAKQECRHALNVYARYGYNVKRQIRNKEGEILWELENHPLKAKNLHSPSTGKKPYW